VRITFLEKVFLNCGKFYKNRLKMGKQCATFSPRDISETKRSRNAEIGTNSPWCEDDACSFFCFSNKLCLKGNRLIGVE